MKQELNDLLKESMEEEEKEVAEQATDDAPEEEDVEDVPSDDADADAEADVDGDTEDLDNEFGSDEEGGEAADDFGGDDMGDESGLDDLDTSDDEVLDMTGASHDEVIKVFKAMKDEDGIIVKKDGDDIEFSDGEEDYIIKLDSGDDDMGDDIGGLDTDVEDFGDEADSGDEFAADTDVDAEVDAEDSEDELMNEDEEVVYEIELEDEELSEEDEEEVKEEDAKEVEVGEASRTAAFGVRGLTSKKAFKAGRHEMNEEVKKLKKQNEEYRKALVLFKDKLNEVAVFNANLAYATRLFTEHSTTKQEKINILKRFDSVSTLNESKKLYSAIKSELDVKQPVSEAVVEKIKSTPSTSKSKEVLAEAKAYENPQFKRMKDLMSKIK